MVNGEIIFVYVYVYMYCVSYCLMIVQPLGGGAMITYDVHRPQFFGGMLCSR